MKSELPLRATKRLKIIEEEAHITYMSPKTIFVILRDKYTPQSETIL
jgi:hypothetical protein